MSKLRLGIFVLLSTLFLISSKFYPALGMGEDHAMQGSREGAMYTFHSSGQVGERIPDGTCQACHPAPQSEAMQQALSSMGISCSSCHADMTVMYTPDQIRGVMLLTCSSCHAPGSSTACDSCHAAQHQVSFWHFGTEE